MIEINRSGIIVEVFNYKFFGETDVKQKILDTEVHKEIVHYVWLMSTIVSIAIIYSIIQHFWRKDLPKIPQDFWTFIILVNIIFALIYADTGQFLHFIDWLFKTIF